MAKPINMPKLSDEMAEGRIAQWTKQEGDEVKAGDVVAQVETEKATLDIEAFEAGTLIGIVVPAGGTAPVGSPIAWLGKQGEKAPAGAAAARPPATAPAPAPAPARKEEPPPAPPPSAPEPARPPRGRIIASPAARKAARERGLDLSALAGSGPHGRVVLTDVEQARVRGPAAGAPPAERPKRRRELPRRQQLRDETIPLSPMRKAIVRNLGLQKPGAPHFYLEVSVDMRRAVELRAQLAELGEDEVSLNDVVMKAVADALTRHPEMNAAWRDDAIQRKVGVHLGMAVAVEEGLVTPVLRDADKKSISQLGREAKELAKLARDKRLKPEQYQGGTFTVSNLGMFGIEGFYAIINPPEAGIVAVGAVQKVPWVDEEGGVVAMERCQVTLSGDHRIVDGAVGARFLQTLKAILEQPLRMVM